MTDDRARAERQFIEQETEKFMPAFERRVLNGDPPDPMPFEGLNLDGLVHKLRSQSPIWPTGPGAGGSLLPIGCVLGPRVLVCGGRDYNQQSRLFAVMDEMNHWCPIEVVIEGEASGKVNADKLARRWAEERGVAVMPFPADWDGLGSVAGPRRNLQMLAEGRPDVVVAFPGDRGTRDMLKQAKRCGYATIDLRYEAYGWAGSL